MKKWTKRAVSAVMALAVTLTMAFPAFAESVSPNTGTKTVYLSAKSGAEEFEMDLASGTKSFTIKRSNVKVTAGSTGAKLVGFWLMNYTNSDERMSGSKWNTSGYKSWSYNATLSASKAGTATVTYKIGSKSYKTKLKVLAYKNPVKTLTMTGVNGGKNMASLFKSGAYYTKALALKAKKANAKLTVKPASGWKIRSAEVYDQKEGTSYGIDNWGQGLSAVTLDCGTLQTDREYAVEIVFLNSSNGATLRCSYNVKGSKAQ